MQLVIRGADALRGTVDVPGDKSVTHRALLLGAVAEGVTEIVNPGTGEDNATTVEVIRALGCEVELADHRHWLVHGRGHRAIGSPAEALDCGNSGTTARLLAGLLAGLHLEATLTGDASLSRRPMRRVADPLRDLGFPVEVSEAGTLPLRIARAASSGGERASEHGAMGSAQGEGTRVVLSIASAQVKSAILLSGLFGRAPIEVVEPLVTRDHTERMLRAFGVRAVSSSAYGAPAARASEAAFVRLHPTEGLRGRRIDVPGDISSAAFVLVLGALAGASVVVRDVGVNPTRTALLDVMARMGATVRVRRRRGLSSGEPVADLEVRQAPLRGTVVEGVEIPLLIDELPLVALLAAFAEGETVVRDAAELRVKESDRIEEVARLMSALGVTCETRPDGFRIEGRGGERWAGFSFACGVDHRIALAAMVAASAAVGRSQLDEVESAAVSWRSLDEVLVSLGVGVEPPPAGRLA